MNRVTIARVISCFERIRWLQLQQIEAMQDAAHAVKDIWPELSASLAITAAKNADTLGQFRGPIKDLEELLE